MELDGNLKRISDELEASYEQLKAATDQLNNSEQKYKLLIDNMTDIVWIMDNENIVTFINDEVDNILGYSPSDIWGRELNSIMCPLHRYENCSSIIQEMHVRDFRKQELWMVSSDGLTRKVLETSTRRIFHKDKLIGILGVARDVTDRIQMERKLKKKNKQLSVLNEISSSISSNVAYLHMETLLENISTKIVETINVKLCSIRLMESDGRLHLKSIAGSLKGCIDPNPIDITKDIIGKAITESRVVVMNDIDKDCIEAYNQNIPDSSHLRNISFVPLILNDKAIGVISISSSEAFDDEYLSMLCSIANNITFAIEKANFYSSTKQNYLKTIKALIAAIEAKDPYTQGHSVRVSQYGILIGHEMKLSEEQIDEIEIAGILHDIGKIGINDGILTKPGRLEHWEFEIIKQHPEIGCRILEPIGLPESILNAALLHHKRFDYRGYPERIETNDIPLITRIIGAADAFDAMTSNRSYKQPMTKVEAIEELKRNSGTQFCPDVVRSIELLYQKKLL